MNTVNSPHVRKIYEAAAFQHHLFQIMRNTVMMMMKKVRLG